MRTLILGHHNAGKDVVAEVLQDIYGLRYAGPTSKPLLEEVIKTFPEIKEKGEAFAEGSPFYAFNFDLRELYRTYSGQTFEDLYKNRHKFSQFLYKFGVQLRKTYGNLYLVDKLIDQGTEIIVGLREREEVEETIKTRGIEHVIWVHRYHNPVDPTMEYGLEDVLRVADGTPTQVSILRNKGESLLKFQVSVVDWFYETRISRRLPARV